MTKRSSAPSLVALALLWCVVGTKVEAKESMRQRAPSTQAPLRHQRSAVGQTPSIYRPGVLNQPTGQSCDVARNARIRCGRPDISAAACEATNCCFDGGRCYYGKTVTVQCTKDGSFIVVVARDVTLPPIDLDSFSLLGDGQECSRAYSNSVFSIYQFPVTACGSTVVKEEIGVITYENRMTSSYEVGVGRRGSITRDTTFEVLFQCKYTSTSVEVVVVEINPLQTVPLPVAGVGRIEVNLRLANGQCFTRGCNKVDAAYNSFYTAADYPVAQVLQDPVYVEVRLLGMTDPNLILTLGNCWTTTSPNPHSLPQWDILIDGCPYRDDRYLSSLVPVGDSSGVLFPTHHKRFIFKMFTFVNQKSMIPLREQVYLHCITAVCDLASGHNCEPGCSRKKRDVETVDQTTSKPKVVSSVGPLLMTFPEQ